MTGKVFNQDIKVERHGLRILWPLYDQLPPISDKTGQISDNNRFISFFFKVAHSRLMYWNHKDRSRLRLWTLNAPKIIRRRCGWKARQDLWIPSRWLLYNSADDITHLGRRQTNRRRWVTSPDKRVAIAPLSGHSSFIIIFIATDRQSHRIHLIWHYKYGLEGFRIHLHHTGGGLSGSLGNSRTNPLPPTIPSNITSWMNEFRIKKVPSKGRNLCFQIRVDLITEITCLVKYYT